MFLQIVFKYASVTDEWDDPVLLNVKLSLVAFFVTYFGKVNRTSSDYTYRKCLDFCVLGHIDRKRLFNLINELPTVFDVVTGKKPVKEKSSVNNNVNSNSNNNNNSGGNKAKSAAKMVSDNSVKWQSHTRRCF